MVSINRDKEIEVPQGVLEYKKKRINFIMIVIQKQDFQEDQ